MNPSTEKSERPPVRLGDLLLEQGLITQDQLRIALMEQKAMGKPLGEALLALGFVTEDAMRGALAANLGEVAINLKGVFNGLLTARIGLSAIAVCRHVPNEVERVA